KKLIELRLETNLSKSDQVAFDKILNLQTQEIVILVVAKKLKTETLKHSWVKIFQQTGKIIEAKAIPSYQWQQWVTKRLQHLQIKTTADAFELLIKSYEGNLIDLNQVLLNLQNNHANQIITFEICKQYVTDQNILSVFDLSDSIIS